MYELIQVSDRCFYIQSPAKIGLICLEGRDVCLIDSGSDKDAGRKVRQILEANGWTLRAIYNTHSNADHIGGNRYLQSQTGCRIYAPGMECAFTRHPILEPSFLYGGYPCQDLRHKFLLAQESGAEELTAQAMPQGLEAVALPGHFFSMAGYRSDDGVVYLADCLASRETLDKYKVVFLYDVAAYLDTLKRVEGMAAACFVPAHAEVTGDIAPLARYNRKKTLETAEKILEICREPICFEAVLQRLFTDYGLRMDFQQYVLVGSAVRSYLSWMKDTGLAQASFEDNLLLWQRI